MSTKFARHYQILGSAAPLTDLQANEEALPPLADKGLIAAPPVVSEKAEEMRTHPESTRDLHQPRN